MAGNDRLSVQTYVPAAQREVWRDEADEMDMSQAEYVRAMVQAGRRSFDLSDGESAEEGTGEGAGSPAANPRGSRLKDRVLDVLETEEVADWKDIRAAVTDDIDDRLEESLSELQGEDAIRYSGRRDGYVVVEDGS
ncbi:hypothetical protein BRC85_10860 [Halobacteriales archaeon QS_1_69_70]|nr:MAG: hypothetical protein BRC85_10860 [Halobacteriales archaeon QS_1_69_70]